MSEEFNIFDGYGDQNTDTGGDIGNRFRLFHLNNGWIYKKLVELAREAVKKGHKKIGMGMLFEIIRWTYYSRPAKDWNDHFKLNNDYRSRYARLIMEQEKDLKGIFELRELRS